MCTASVIVSLARPPASVRPGVSVEAGLLKPGSVMAPKARATSRLDSCRHSTRAADPSASAPAAVGKAVRRRAGVDRAGGLSPFDHDRRGAPSRSVVFTLRRRNGDPGDESSIQLPPICSAPPSRTCRFAPPTHDFSAPASTSYVTRIDSGLNRSSSAGTGRRKSSRPLNGSNS